MVAFALIGAVVPAAAAADTTKAMQTANTTNTTTATPTPTPTAAPQSETCEPRPGGPKLQQARLYSPEPTITGDQHGQIAGSIVVGVQNECPVVVQLTLTVPSGMYVAGSGDLSSGGGGVVTSTFVIQPGETKSLRAEVYSNSLGEKTVTSDITYYPQGHKEMAREIDGQMLNFDVQEKNMPDDREETPTKTETGGDAPGSGGDGPGIVQWLLGLVGVTQVGLLLLVGMGLILITKAMPNALELIFERK